jgi:hypothetical protein
MAKVVLIACNSGSWLKVWDRAMTFLFWTICNLFFQTGPVSLSDYVILGPGCAPFPTIAHYAIAHCINPEQGAFLQIVRGQKFLADQLWWGDHSIEKLVLVCTLRIRVKLWIKCCHRFIQHTRGRAVVEYLCGTPHVGLVNYFLHAFLALQQANKEEWRGPFLFWFCCYLMWLPGGIVHCVRLCSNCVP